MVLSSTMHPIESYLALPCDEHENISICKPTSTLLSNRFTCSIHNCLCKQSKIGLVLYPKDIETKNVILLVCNQCYNGKLENSTPHNQLEKWYFNIYKDSISFQFKARFLQNEDGSFCFSNSILSINDLFDIKERQLEHWEQEVIQQTLKKKMK